MDTPSKADISKLDNPAQAKVNHQLGTELRGGNELYEAVIKSLWRWLDPHCKFRSPKLVELAKLQT